MRQESDLEILSVREGDVKLMCVYREPLWTRPSVRCMPCVRACSRLSLRVYCVLIRLCDARRWPTWMPGPSGDPPFGLFRSPLPWKLDAPGTGTLPDRFHNLSPFIRVAISMGRAWVPERRSGLVHKETLLLGDDQDKPNCTRIKQQPKKQTPDAKWRSNHAARWGAIRTPASGVFGSSRVRSERVKNLPEDTPKDKRCSARAPRESLALAPRANPCRRRTSSRHGFEHMSRT